MSKLMFGVLCGLFVLLTSAVLPPPRVVPQPSAQPMRQQPPAAAQAGAPAGPAAAAPKSPTLQPGFNPVAVFEITGSGKLVSNCINGTDPTCTGKVESDAAGKTYLFFDNLTLWHIGTGLDENTATQFTGLVDGKGGFTMSGTHSLSGSQVMLTGKVTFQKGTLTPTKVSGKLYAVSDLVEHYGSGSFKSVAKIGP